MYKLIVIFGLIAGALAGGDKCPKAFGKFPYDDSKMVGDWKVIAGTPMMSAPCSTLTYKSDGTLHSVFYSGIGPDGKPHKGEIIGQYFGPPGKAQGANALAVFKKEDGKIIGPFHQTLIETDYENHALLMACMQVFDEKNKKFTRQLRIGILSRKTTLSKETLDVLTNLATSFDITHEEIKMVDHSKC